MAKSQENPLRSLPIEIQRLILIPLLSSIEVTPVRITSEGVESDEFNRDTIYRLAQRDVEKLSLYQTIFSTEAREPWESYVQFHFPSTVAMLDILLGPEFTPERRKLIKRVKYVAYPVPLYGQDHSCYMTHFPGNFFSLMTGLELDLLEYEDAYIANDDGWGKEGFTGDATMMIESPGWKRLEVTAEWIRLDEGDRQRFNDVVARIQTERNEPDFSYELDVTVTSEGRQDEDGSHQEEVDETNSEMKDLADPAARL
ncbi:hypothetical protein NM208_g8113 [Fusarium decemcellulare]|uniref:Uncharacterized protein n=1 Tax=Fusarium decemcellulare TaxID=57161 RepID=A0ACC1S6N4_9HYPO|nr:hypothetical protein NM208_g8113 [Fusarium decemcellulare]